MAHVFTIEDDQHADPIEGEFASFEAALDELKRIAALPFGAEPNLPPCTNWANCRRYYVILETDQSTTPYWTTVKRTSVLEITKSGAQWLPLDE
jgi:hypothetical protein